MGEYVHMNADAVKRQRHQIPLGTGVIYDYELSGMGPGT